MAAGVLGVLLVVAGGLLVEVVASRLLPQLQHRRWYVLFVVVVLLVCATAVGLRYDGSPSAGVAAGPGGDGGAVSEAESQAMPALRELNQLRDASNLSGLVLDSHVSDLAVGRAKVWGYGISPEPVPPIESSDSQRISPAEVFAVAGSLAEVPSALSQAEHFLENVLVPEYDTVGIGIAEKGNSGHYVIVVLFEDLSGGVNPPPSPTPTSNPPSPTVPPIAIRGDGVAEQAGSYGSATFANPQNASGQGPSVDSMQWVEVDCKVYVPSVASVNPDGYWYRLASSPWNGTFYAPANRFWNGDVPGQQPYLHNTDFAVPNC